MVFVPRPAFNFAVHSATVPELFPMTLQANRLIIIAFLAAATSCTGQPKKTKNMSKATSTTNPLLCDPDTGICAVPASGQESPGSKQVQATEKPIKVIYFTDPICSSCWGIEPQLRKLKLEYGNLLEVEYRMGGLLPDWSYNSGGISKPSDVAHHWDEVSAHYDMPIDGDVWLEDPLPSSYPPSIAFKAAQLQGKDKAVHFLRALREMVFLDKKNITRWEHIATAARSAELDVAQLKTDYEGQAKALFEEDLKMARAYGVRGFPTLFFIDGKGNRETVYGSKPYSAYEATLANLQPQSVKSTYNKSWEALFALYPTLTAREFAELSGTARGESEQTLKQLAEKGHLKEMKTKNGSLWSLNQ